jgi:hypothetical protein
LSVPPNSGLMTRTPAAVLLGALSCATALLTGTACPASADLTVTGDGAAWNEVIAAYGKLNALPGYRIKTAVPGGGTMVLEMVPATPAMHTVIQTPNGNAEMIAVSGQTRMRTTMPGAPAGWQCAGAPPMPPLDPKSFQGTVNVARAPDTSIDGQAMHVYVYSAGMSPGAAGPGKTTLYVGAANGLPRRAVIGDQTMDFYDYGAPIQITLPPCGGAQRTGPGSA